LGARTMPQSPIGPRTSPHPVIQNGAVHLAPNHAMRSAVKTAKRVPVRSTSTAGRSHRAMRGAVAQPTVALWVGADLPRLNAYPRSSDAPRLSSAHAGAPIAMGPVRHARPDPWDLLAQHRPHRRVRDGGIVLGIEPVRSSPGFAFAGAAVPTPRGVHCPPRGPIRLEGPTSLP
jgi:hypothetical protein